MKRERNQKNANTAKSQLKVVRYYGQWVHYCTRHALHRDGMLTAQQNQAAMDIQCQVCKSTFLKTTKAPEYVFAFSFTRIFERGDANVHSRLTLHAQNKHSKALGDCFPNVAAAA